MLSQEAKRVNTPPMFPGTPSVQPRGFFFDLASSKADNTSGSAGSSIAAKNRSNGTSPNLDWWEADTEHALTGSKSKSQPQPPSFELNLPEHLPNSPLCPKNPNHKSGGAGICPYHGRRRSNNLKNSARVDSQESGVIQRLLGTSTGGGCAG